MKTLRVLKIAAVTATAWTLLAAVEHPAGAYPGTSPSAVAAARLKYNPPRNWIRHYLGDDRYKIKGGTWKVLSTETDRYYYPAWAPEMLRQPPGIVIGFASAHDAEEAGYLRSNYPMELPTLGIETSTPTPAAAPANPGLNVFSLPQEGLVTTVNNGAARRVLLADNASTAILPKGWTHLKQTRAVATGRTNTQVLVDLMVPGLPNMAALRSRNARFVAFAFMEMPGVNAEAIFSQRGMGAMNSAMNRTSRVDSRAGRSMPNMRSASFGNIRGMTMPVPVPEYGTLPIVFGARGSKVYMMVDTSRGARGASTVINSFRGR